MEFPSIGRKCANPTCKQLDFLPIVCGCKQTFCSEHFKSHSDECRVDKHVQELKKIEAYECAHANCQTRNIIPITCQKCGKHFCLAHRHIIDCEPQTAQDRYTAIEKMNAPQLEFQKYKEVVDKQLDITLTNAKRKQKNVGMANKLQLMRLKNKAIGLKSIPSIDRVYFNTHIPSSKSAVPIFVSKKWSLGRTIDAIADECKQRNQNNQENALQLRLFKKDDGIIISTNLSDILETLLDDVIMDGQDIILDFVKADSESI